MVELAHGLGLNVFGENYVSELLDKAEPSDSLVWHYLGAIQRKKVAKLAPVVDLFQGLCRLEEAEAIAKVKPQAKVLIQIDTTGFDQRNGLRPEDFPDFFAQLSDVDVEVLGVMCVAPPEREAAKACFAKVRGLADEFQFPVCSMGMTGDLRDAVAAGSTMVRIGSALFGPRG